MSYDLKIEGGTIIDGTGRAGYRGDVAIGDGRIVAVGACAGSARSTLDAHGAIVTPGFVDLHTHYDGQVSWDDALAPSSLHGVTTCVMGSCGVGFAPVRAADRQRVIELMEGVEDIPGAALAEGIRWSWETFPEYMDAIERRPYAIDVAVQVPHDVLRVYAMGERAVAGEEATDDDIVQMRAMVREALEAGAVGFSTGRTDNHRTARGQATPASEATTRELCGIAKALHGLGHGVVQAVSDFDLLVSDARFSDEFDVLERLAQEVPDHGMSISLMQRDQSPQQWKWIIERAERAHARGTTIRLQVAPRGIGVLLGLDATFHPFMGFPSYKAIAHRSRTERVEAMRDPALRARMLAETSDEVAGDGSSLPPLADILLAQLDRTSKRLYRLGEWPDYEPDPRTCLWAEAQAAGRRVLEVIYDALLEDDGRALLYFPVYNFAELDLEAVRVMLTHPLALPGLSDGGAHVGTICDASFPTFMLTHWGRDRPRGRIDLPTLVKMQTHDTARFIGLRDRGVIAPGLRADLNVIDMARLRLRSPRMQADLPAGGHRLMQRAEGYRATLVAGAVIARDGALTEARPGRLVRAGQ